MRGSVAGQRFKMKGIHARFASKGVQTERVRVANETSQKAMVPDTRFAGKGMLGFEDKGGRAKF